MAIHGRDDLLRTEPAHARAGNRYRPLHALAEPGQVSPLVLLSVAFTCLVIVVGIDTVLIDRGLWDEGEPVWDLAHILRTALIGVAAASVIMALVEWNGPRRSATGVPFQRFDRVFVLAIPLGAAFFVSLLAVSPRYFTRFALEDRPVEWVSVVLLFVAAGLTVLATRQVIARATSGRWWAVGPLGLAVLFFLIAMEEVSWFQRVLDVETPDALASNAQGELNFHNFATGLSENGYYFGAFLALMVAPLVMQAFALSLPAPFEGFAPTPVVALVSAPAFAFNFDMWDVILSQVAFYGAVAVLALWVINEVESEDRWLVVVMIAATVFVQLMMLVFGHRSDLIWDATEYKEMFIPVGFAVYALDVYRRVRQPRASSIPDVDGVDG